MNEEEESNKYLNQLFALSPTQSISSVQEDFQSVSDSVGDQTIVESLLPIMSTSIPPAGTTVVTTTSAAFGSRRFQIASSMVNTLSKITITDKLNDTNYSNWSSEIKTGIKSLSLLSFLLSNKDESPIDADTKLFNEVVRESLTTWIISKLDQANRNRFEPFITVETEIGPEVDSVPSKLWIKIRDHHSPRTPAHQMLLRRLLFGLTQGGSTLPEHLDEFHRIYTSFCNSGGKIGSVELGQQLLMSLNSDWIRVAEDIADSDKFEYNSVVTALKVQITNRALLHPTTKVLPIIESSAASPMRRRQGFVQTRCSPKKCVSLTHTEAECIRNPKNIDKYNAWVESKKAKGQWVDRNPTSTSSVTSAPSSSSVVPTSSFPSLSSLQDALDRSEFSVSASAVYIVDSASNVESEHFGIVDSGTTHHMFKLEKFFDQDHFVMNSSDNQRVGLAGGASTLQIKGKGNVTLIGPTGDVTTLTDCLFVPDLKQNLIAGGRLLHEGWITTRRPDGSFVVQRNGKTSLSGRVDPNSMLLHLNTVTQTLRT